MILKRGLRLDDIRLPAYFGAKAFTQTRKEPIPLFRKEIENPIKGNRITLPLGKPVTVRKRKFVYRGA